MSYLILAVIFYIWVIGVFVLVATGTISIDYQAALSFYVFELTFLIIAIILTVKYFRNR